MAARLRDLHRSFARHLRAEGRSERTAVVYGQAVRFFSRWLETQERTATLDELTRAAIREWLATLVDAGLEPSTIKTATAGCTGSAAGWSTRAAFGRLLAQLALPDHDGSSVRSPMQARGHAGASARWGVLAEADRRG